MSADQLAPNDWQVLSIGEDGGAARHVSPDEFRVVRFDGNGGFSTDGCNRAGGTVLIEANRAQLRESFRTQAGCLGEPGVLDSLTSRLLSGEAVWERTGDDLRLSGSGVVARLRPRTPPFPDHALTPLIQEDGVDGGRQFEVGWVQRDDGRLWLASYSRAARGLPWNRFGTALELASGLADMKWHPIDGVTVLFGGVPRATTSVQLQSPGQPARSLSVFELPEGVKVFAGTIDVPKEGVVVAFGADGAEVDRSHDLSTLGV